MYCYKHHETMAHQLCGTCFKALCKDCSISMTERPEAVICSESCCRDYLENLQIHERAKMLYGIGKYARISSWSISRMIFLIMGVFFMGLSGVLFGLQSESEDLYSITWTFILGAIFFIISLAEQLRRKKFGVKF